MACQEDYHVDFRDIENRGTKLVEHMLKLALDIFHDSAAIICCKMCSSYEWNRCTYIYSRCWRKRTKIQEKQYVIKLEVFGVKIDNEKNQTSRGEEAEISSRRLKSGSLCNSNK